MDYAEVYPSGWCFTGTPRVSIDDEIKNGDERQQEPDSGEYDTNDDYYGNRPWPRLRTLEEVVAR